MGARPLGEGAGQVCEAPSGQGHVPQGWAQLAEGASTVPPFGAVNLVVKFLLATRSHVSGLGVLGKREWRHLGTGLTP